MILFYDTETTGLPLWREPSEHPDQPHIVQLAALLCLDGVEIASLNAIVRPDGWTIPAETTAIHGISQERALVEGISEHQALAIFMCMVQFAERRVAHNESFDARIIRIALHRYRFSQAEEWEAGPPAYCTMRASQDLCKLAPTAAMAASGRLWNKPPKLGEAYQHFFGEDLSGAHDALVDVVACKRIYLELERRAEG